ncbi:MAG: TolC family protein [Bacteroidales bacterium]|nr:TolC family protein [Bacteroidales bacterium]
MRRVFTLLLSILPLAAGAQEWTLQQCIDYALEHNITVRQGSISVQQGEIDLNTAQMSRLPAVSGSASESLSFGRGIGADNVYENANTTGTGFNLGAQVPVFQGFAINHQIALRKLNLAAAEANLEKIKDDIRMSVARAYVQILYDMEILDVARSQVGIDSLQVERLEAMKLTGKASAAQVAQQKSALGQSRYSAAVATSNLSIATLELTQLLELPSPEGFVVARPHPAELDVRLLDSPEDIYADAVVGRASVLAEQRRLEVAEKQIDLAKSQYYPSLSLSGGIGTNYYTTSRTQMASFADQMKNNFSQSLGLTLSIPIFNRFATRNQVRSAQLARDNQQLQLESSRKSLYKEIQQAWYNALAAQTKYLSSQDAEASAAESYNLVLAKYEGGKANITEFNEAKQNYLKSASDLAQARYEFLYSSRLLSFYRDGVLDF